MNGHPDDSLPTPVTPANCLDGATFEVIVHRIQDPSEARGGPWLIRVYHGDEHVHSAEGGVSLNTGLNEARSAILLWVERNGGGPRPLPAPAEDQLEFQRVRRCSSMSFAIDIPPDVREANNLPDGDLIVVSGWAVSADEGEPNVGLWIARVGEHRTGQRWPITVPAADAVAWSESTCM